MKSNQHIVIDARWIIPEPSGIGIYTGEMISRLPKILSDFQFTILFRTSELVKKSGLQTGISELANVETMVVPYGPFSPKGQLLLPLLLRRIGCSLFHTTNYAMPYLAFPKGGRGRIRSVAVIHDVIPLAVKDYAPNSRTSRMLPLYRECLRQTILRADRIVTVSESSKRDIVRALSVKDSDANKIIAVHNGVSNAFKPLDSECASSDGKRTRILLYVGRLDPYKNVPKLVRAFASAKKNLSFPVRLRIVGPPDLRYPESLLVAKELGVSDAVEFNGFLTGDELAESYRTADLLVHPSGYEGFGLQIIEAMKSGLPVICCDGGAQAEVAGDAAVIVTPGDVGAMTDAIVDLLSNPAKAAHLRELGLQRAIGFSWDSAAESIARIYRDLL